MMLQMFLLVLFFLSQGPMWAAEHKDFDLSDESEKPMIGNWHKKLQAHKDAKWLYTVDVVSSLDQVDQIKDEYAVQQKQYFDVLDSYYDSLPVHQADEVSTLDVVLKDIDELVQDIAKRQEALAQEQAQAGKKISPQEKAQLDEQEKLLIALKDSMNLFSQLYDRFTQVYTSVVPQQIARAQSYEKQAKQAFEQIDLTLDDKQARALLAQVEATLANINDLQGYLRGTLTQYTGQLWQKAQTLMPRITQQLAELEQKGVVVRSLTEQEKLHAQQLEQERQELKARKEAQKLAKERERARPWWQKAAVSVQNALAAGWVGLKEVFVGVGSSSEAEKEVLPAAS